MPDGGITEAIIIGGLLTAGTVATQAYMQGQAPKPPSPGKDPGAIPSANQAQSDASALRQRALQRRSLDSLRIDPVATGTGLQVPAP